ncbi:MAG TPA: efflux transporter outer membrane subunit [Burkholderiaceae bacterium]|nr:efflux transporter outer membrane subunit [Burkholderiaceae bacterium]
MSRIFRATPKLPPGSVRQRLGAIALLLLGGCAAGPDFVGPAPPAVERYTPANAAAGQSSATFTADGQSQEVEPGRRLAADWWRLFGSAELDSAVQQAMAGNVTLESARASLRQSRENLQAGYGVFYPTIDLGFSAVRQRTSPLRFGVNTASGVFNLFTLSTAISYALDVFGGERRTVEALGAQVDYQRYTARAAYLALSGNVVNTTIARAAYQAQIQATEELIARQQEQLDIAKTQASAGTASYASVLSIQSQLAASQATVPALRQKSDQAEHLLATLAGRTPAESRPPEVDLASLALPRQLPLALPSDLVRLRPDILAAEAQLHAASAGIGIATAALFPSFSLSGTYGSNSTTFGDLGNSGGKFWSVGPSVDFPLFQGGASWHRKQAAIEAYRKSLADYRQVVLNAFAQVADALTALEHDAQSLDAQAQALRSAEQGLSLLEANYRAGLVGYLQVLVADAQFHQAKINYLQASAQRYQDTTALFLALGSGWWNQESDAGSGQQERRR